ncbi:AbrB/MazE/SpoVT family DNA-binding domain-containing protein [Paenibacillus paeoniae]|uniref:AbrB/MazE/SpoVT family DNA-binding domain-containing protein n=1 Tax=Paenibacillus paeoniae TaxID=2292705 RepID=UPI001401E079|nr:AbrB/MazE/SpoVT family DNA-binding domain-containing protein [Paenibacillus paeoniae]
MPKGIVRKLDDLCRIVVPREIQRQLEWIPQDEIEITVSGQVVSLRRYMPGCVLCAAEDNLAKVNGKNLCLSCRTSAARTVARR